MFNLKSSYIKIVLFIFTSFIYSQDVTLSFGAVDDSTGTMEISMTNTVDVAGFQFNIEGATLTGGSGGSAEDAGFMVSTSATTVIGFSLSGSVISAGTGILTNLTFSDLGTYSCIEGAIVSDIDGLPLEVTIGDCIGDAPIYGCTDAEACNYDAGADTDDGSCEYPEGTCDCDGMPTGDYCDCDGNMDVGCGCGESQIECWDESMVCDAMDCPTSMINISYDSPSDIGGFQFDIDGVTVVGASGGAAEAAGFMVSAGSTTVIGFSLSGTLIDAGSGVLTILEVQGNPDDACMVSGDTELVIADPAGVQMYSWVDNCLTINCNLPDAPPTPENLTATVSGGGSGNDVSLAWDASNSAEGYNVYQDGSMISSTSNTSFGIDDLGYSTTFNFCVSAYNVGGDSDQACIDATTGEAPPEPLIEPENLTAEAGDTVVLLNWDDPPGEVAGTLTINLTTDQWAAETTWELVSSNGELLASNPALNNETEYSTDVELEAGSYTWTIFDSYGDGICCAYGEGSYELLLNGASIASGGEFGTEESVQFSVDGMVMSITTGYYAEPHGYEKGEIIENWEDLDVDYTIQEFENVDRDLLGYNIYRSEVSGSGHVMIGSTDLDTQTYLDEGLINETTYYYEVTAVYDGGESDPSNEASATPMPYVPDPASNLVAEPGDGHVDLSWNSPQGFNGFPPCPDGSAEYVDCAGNCFNNADCADATYDGCVEGNSTWLGDTFCDDGSFNLVFWLPDNECPEYGNDCGDCGAFDPELDDPYGICNGDGGGDTECTSIDNFNVTSPEECLEDTNYFTLAWDGGCELTSMNYGVYDINENAFDLSGYGFVDSFSFYGFGPNESYMFQVCSGDICTDIVDATSSSIDCGGGDAVGYGLISTEQMPPELVKHFNPNPENYNPTTREELTGFDVHRSDMTGGPYDLIATTDSETIVYNDATVMNGSTYYYVVTAVYDIGDSDPSNEASATPMNTVTLGLSDAAVISGDNVTITVSMDNVEVVSGMQIDLSDIPDFLTVVGITATDRIPDDWTLEANEQADGDSRILGFSLSGTQIDPGSGSLLDVEFSTQADYPAEVSLCTTGESFSDPDGQAYFVGSSCSVVDVSIGYSIALGMDVLTETADVLEDVIVELSIDTDTPVSSITVQIIDSPDAVGFVAVDAGNALPVGWECGGTLTGEVTCSGAEAFVGSGVFARAYGLVNETAFSGMVEFSYASSNILDSDGSSLYVGLFDSDSFEVYPGFLLSPMNLVAESGQNGEVPLTWQGMPDPVWVGYDSGGNYTSIGTGSAADFDVAIKFEQDQLSEYPGMNISKIRFFPNEVSCEYSVRVWYGSTMVVDQPVSDVVIGDWNEVDLMESVPLPSEGDLYIGYRSITTTGFPAGSDGGPAVEGYGDLISLDGGGWTSISQSYGLNYNWNLNAYLASPFGDIVELNPIESTPSSTVGMITESGIINTDNADNGMFLISNDSFNVWSSNINRELDLTGYNVYRSDVSGSGYAMIGETDGSTTEYIDIDVDNGSTYYYVVSSVYDNEHISAHSNEAEAMPMSWIELDLTGGEVQGGDEITLTFSMTNDEPVAGLQFDLADVPDYLYFSNVVGTNRVPNDWSLSGAEQEAGNTRVIGFSFTGSTIDAGSGPILEITLGSIASMPTDVEICTTNESFADSEGNPFPSESVCSTVSIDVESINVSMSAVGDPVDQGDTFEVTISMDSPVDVYGFQLEIEDAPESITAINVQPSALLEEAGGMFQWSELDGYVNALWFTLDLSALSVSGDLFTITYQVDADADDGISDICFRPTSVFSDENGIQVYTQYECSSVTVGVPDVMLSLEQTSSTTYDVHMDNAGLVAGIQFTISDDPEMLSYVNIQTTSRVPGDWMVQGNDINGATTLVGFSLAGSTIDIGSGSIATITVDHSMMDNMVDLCFDSFVISDPLATPWYTSAQCAEFVMPFGPSEVTQDIMIDAYAFNMLSLNVLPEDLAINNIMSTAGILLAKDDDGAFYAPDFGVNQIGDMNLTEGYKVFINGANDQMVSIIGEPVDPMQTLLIEAYKLNSLPYLPQTEILAEDAFGDYDENILLVANDSGEFYVPAFGVYSLDMLYPGEAYSIFLNGANDVSFNYPDPGLARTEVSQENRDYYNSCVAEHYKPVRTGLSSPIIITDLNGYINIGDELAAYANGELVGAIKVMDMNKPAVITVWEGYSNHSISLPGYMVGDEIELRVWNNESGRELRVESNLTENTYGASPVISGGITIYDMLAIPEDYTLNQNYPNPFNPSTNIEFSIPENQNIIINIYDIQGRLVNTLFDGMIESGYHNVMWSGTDSYGQTVSAGLYLYTLQGKNIGLTRKMVFMK